MATIDHSVPVKDIQGIIDKVAANGGGVITFKSGRYETGTLIMRSDIRFHLDEGADIVGKPDINAYKSVVKTISKAENSGVALIYALNAKNIGFSGKGKISCNGESYFAQEADSYGYRLPAEHRPRIVVFEGCQDIKIVDITLADAPMWTLHLVSCDQVVIDNLKIDNNLTLPNTDGIDIDSCSNVAIRNSRITTADDAICIKTTKKPDGSGLRLKAENILIDNCFLLSHSAAFKIGTETHYDIDNVKVSNCTIRETNRGLGIQSRDGGAITNISIESIDVQCVSSPACHWGKADPISVSVRPRDPKKLPGKVINFYVRDVSGVANGALNFFSEPESYIENLYLENIRLKQTVSSQYIEEQGLYDIRPPCNPKNPTGMGLDNSYVINPVTKLPYGVDKFPGGMPCVFTSGCKISTHSIVFERPNPLPEGWNPVEVVSVDSLEHP